MEIHLTKDESHFMMILLNEPQTENLISTFKNNQWFTKQKENILKKIKIASDERL